MPLYIVKQAPPGATLADAADGFVINFPGTMMQMAEKLASTASFPHDTDKVAAPRRDPPSRKKSRKHNAALKGQLRPFKERASARVRVLEVLQILGQQTRNEIFMELGTLGEAAVRQAISKNDAAAFLEIDDDVCKITERGIKALQRYNSEFPNHQPAAVEGEDS